MIRHRKHWRADIPHLRYELPFCILNKVETNMGSSRSTILSRRKLRSDLTWVTINIEVTLGAMLFIIHLLLYIMYLLRKFNVLISYFPYNEITVRFHLNISSILIISNEGICNIWLTILRFTFSWDQRSEAWNHRNELISFIGCLFYGRV